MTDLDLEEEDYRPAGLPASPVVPQEWVFTLPLDAAGARLDQVLARLLPEQSRSRLTTLIKAGLVSVDGAAATAKQKVRGLESVRVLLAPRPEQQAFAAERLALDIVHEDNQVIVLDKAAGMVVHPAAGNWQGTLLNGLLHHAPALAAVPRAGIVHRLDKDTSGLMVVAKTIEAQVNLVRQLQARTVKREYWALARCPAQAALKPAGTIDAPIGRHPRQRTRMAVVPEVVGGKPAITHYRVLERLTHHCVLECRLETGRTHQIRVHLSTLGLPLEGDSVYAPRRTATNPRTDAVGQLAGFPRQALHARALAFTHPASGELVSFAVHLPPDLQRLLALAREL